jgi:hypothetical protein
MHLQHGVEGADTQAHPGRSGQRSWGEDGEDEEGPRAEATSRGMALPSVRCVHGENYRMFSTVPKVVLPWNTMGSSTAGCLLMQAL